MKRFLVATDLSARSRHALERGVVLARANSGSLCVVHVVDDEMPAVLLDKFLGLAESEVKSNLDAIGIGDIDTSVRIVRGSDYREIIKAAHADEADLIVLGGHRHTGSDGVLAGKTMQRVIRNGTLPVLVVASPATGPYERIVVGVDFSIYSRFAVRTALSLAGDAELYIVHAFQIPFMGFLAGDETQKQFQGEHEVRLRKLVEEEMAYLTESSAPDDSKNLNVKTVIRNGDTREVLQSETKRLRSNLVILGTHGRTGLAQHYFGSVATDFLKSLPCDVLVVKAW
jgi:nucleotide-binding universal stress UspA family protein